MTVQEFCLRLLDAVQPSIPAAMIALGLSLLAILTVVVQTHGLWVNQRRFQWLGILYGLSRWACIRLACCWVKLLLLLAYLVLFQSMSAADYLLVAVPGLICTVNVRAPLRIPVRILWLALEMLGLMSVNLVCGFYRDMDAGLIFLLIYVVMAIFMALFAWYLFMTELQEISQGRSADFADERESGKA